MRRWSLFAFGLMGSAILAGLGVWQTQRLAWKEELIAQMDARLAAPPLNVAGVEDPDRFNFHAARADGRFAADAETARFLTSMRPFGPGHRHIAPFTLENGRTILVDRGYAPIDAAPSPPDPGPIALDGALHWPRERSSFTPDPNLETGLWFARETERLAAALGTEPVLLVLATPDHAGEWPRPAPVGVDLTNNHLSYAITWFCLSAIWLTMSVVLIARRGRPDQGSDTGGPNPRDEV